MLPSTNDRCILWFLLCRWSADQSDVHRRIWARRLKLPHRVLVNTCQMKTSQPADTLVKRRRGPRHENTAAPPRREHAAALPRRDKATAASTMKPLEATIARGHPCLYAAPANKSVLVSQTSLEAPPGGTDWSRLCSYLYNCFLCRMSDGSNAAIA